LFCLSVGGLAVSSQTAGASVASDQADIAQIQKQIAADGAHAQALVSRFNAVQAHVNELDAQIAHDEKLVATALRDEAAAMSAMRRVAIKAYTTGTGMGSPTLEMLSSTSDINRTLERNHYLGAVGSKWEDALTQLRLSQARTRDAESGLRADQTQANKTLRDLTSARDAATAAIAAGEAKLTRVNGDLRTLLAAAAAKRHAQEAAAERALAAAALAPSPQPPPLSAAAPPTVPAPTFGPSTAPPPTGPPSPGPPPSSSGGYANPLRAITALVPERVDQGVDYAGFGSLYAIGNGVVLNTVGSGWPGGTFIAYQLSDGPAAGLVVFAAEDIQPSVQVGDRVTSNTVIGHMYAGPYGIEMGWADGSRLPDTMARRYGQYNGSNPTAFGYNFSRLLQSVGAPGGILNGAPTGDLPASWPRW
jgi:murein DD-endopeptidase MepM/ murein hydrolase activator NlpD